MSNDIKSVAFRFTEADLGHLDSIIVFRGFKNRTEALRSIIREAASVETARVSQEIDKRRTDRSIAKIRAIGETERKAELYGIPWGEAMMLVKQWREFDEILTRDDWSEVLDAEPATEPA